MINTVVNTDSMFVLFYSLGYSFVSYLWSILQVHQKVFGTGISTLMYELTTVYQGSDSRIRPRSKIGWCLNIDAQKNLKTNKFGGGGAHFNALLHAIPWLRLILILGSPRLTDPPRIRRKVLLPRKNTTKYSIAIDYEESQTRCEIPQIDLWVRNCHIRTPVNCLR
jgi:hypothetical protein